MASAISRAAAATALRRAAVRDRAVSLYPAAGFHVFSGNHRGAPLEPRFRRFGRPRHCYRTSSGPDEQESRQEMQHLEGMEREALLQYAKKVTVENDALQKGECQYDPVQARLDVMSVKAELQEIVKRIDQVEKSGKKSRDLTSIYVKNHGSINVIALGTALYTVYQLCHKFF